MPIAVVALVLFLSQLNAYPQEKGDYAFWPEMPEAARVIKDVQGKNEVDTAARRLAAYRLLDGLVRANAGRIGRLPWPPREQELYHAYTGLIYERQRPKESGPRDLQIEAQSFRFQADRAFTRPLLARYFSPAALREIEPIVSRVEADAQRQIKQEQRSSATTAPAADSTYGPREFFLKVLEGRLMTNSLFLAIMVILTCLGGWITWKFAKKKTALNKHEFEIRNAAGILTFNTYEESLVHAAKQNRMGCALQFGILLWAVSLVVTILDLTYVYLSSL